MAPLRDAQACQGRQRVRWRALGPGGDMDLAYGERSPAPDSQVPVSSGSRRCGLGGTSERAFGAGSGRERRDARASLTTGYPTTLACGLPHRGGAACVSVASPRHRHAFGRRGTGEHPADEPRSSMRGRSGGAGRVCRSRAAPRPEPRPGLACIRAAKFKLPERRQASIIAPGTIPILHRPTNRSIAAPFPRRAGGGWRGAVRRARRAECSGGRTDGQYS